MSGAPQWTLDLTTGGTRVAPPTLVKYKVANHSSCTAIYIYYFLQTILDSYKASASFQHKSKNFADRTMAAADTIL